MQGRRTCLSQIIYDTMRYTAAIFVPLCLLATPALVGASECGDEVSCASHTSSVGASLLQSSKRLQSKFIFKTLLPHPVDALANEEDQADPLAIEGLAVQAPTDNDSVLSNESDPDESMLLERSALDSGSSGSVLHNETAETMLLTKSTHDSGHAGSVLPNETPLILISKSNESGNASIASKLLAKKLAKKLAMKSAMLLAKSTHDSGHAGSVLPNESAETPLILISKSNESGNASAASSASLLEAREEELRPKHSLASLHADDRKSAGWARLSGLLKSSPEEKHKPDRTKPVSKAGKKATEEEINEASSKVGEPILLAVLVLMVVYGIFCR